MQKKKNMAIVYEHLRNDTNEVFYVGIGKEEGRAYNKTDRNPHWKRIVGKVGYRVNIIHKDIDWEKACEIEKSLIKEYGRKNLGLGNLVNMTDGGDGAYGVLVSEETRQKISVANKGRTPSEETKLKLSAAHKGKTFSEETRLKLSEASKGKPKSEEHKKKMSEVNKGRTPSEETRQKLSELRKGDKHPMFGKTRSEETRQKLSEANKGDKHPMFGKPQPEETRQKISEANKGKIRSDETRQKISEARKGKIRSEETRQKMSESLKGKARSEEKRQKIRHKISESVNDKKNVKGYSFHKPSKKWRATIKTIHIGSFDTPEEAAEAYQKARLIYFV